MPSKYNFFLRLCELSKGDVELGSDSDQCLWSAYFPTNHWSCIFLDAISIGVHGVCMYTADVGNCFMENESCCLISHIDREIGATSYNTVVHIISKGRSTGWDDYGYRKYHTLQTNYCTIVKLHKLSIQSIFTN